jgi:hypothetical protein
MTKEKGDTLQRIVFIELKNGLHAMKTVDTVNDMLELINDTDIKVIPSTPLGKKIFDIRLTKHVYKTEFIKIEKPSLAGRFKNLGFRINKLMFSKVF